jgi:endonuclease-3
MASKAAKDVGTELAMKYSFRNKRQLHSHIHKEEDVLNQLKPCPENELSKVKKGATKDRTSKRRCVSIAFEDNMDIKPMQKEGTSFSNSKAREIENSKSKWEPKNWREVVSNIREMRKQRDAPVDTMGCDKCADESAPPEVNVDCCCFILC